MKKNMKTIITTIIIMNIATKTKEKTMIWIVIVEKTTKTKEKTIAKTITKETVEETTIMRMKEITDVEIVVFGVCLDFVNLVLNNKKW